MLLATMFFGCSDNVESKESWADDYEERLGRVYDQAEDAIRIALKERGVREGFDKSRGTITAVAVCAFDSDDEFRKAEEEADFSEEYDFKVPNGAGMKSQYAFLIGKNEGGWGEGSKMKGEIFVTAAGLFDNEYAADVQSSVVLDDLFAPGLRCSGACRVKVQFPRKISRRECNIRCESEGSEDRADRP